MARQPFRPAHRDQGAESGGQAIKPIVKGFDPEREPLEKWEKAESAVAVGEA